VDENVRKGGQFREVLALALTYRLFQLTRGAGHRRTVLAQLPVAVLRMVTGTG
jgi:hypothetical protein